MPLLLRASTDVPARRRDSVPVIVRERLAASIGQAFVTPPSLPRPAHLLLWRVDAGKEVFADAALACRVVTGAFEFAGTFLFLILAVSFLCESATSFALIDAEKERKRDLCKNGVADVKHLYKQDRGSSIHNMIRNRMERQV